MATNNDIRACIDSRLSSIPGLPTIVYENTGNFPQDPTDHIETKLFPTMNRARTMGPDPFKEKTGFYRAIIRIPLSIGSGKTFDYADLIEDYFQPGKYLSGTRIAKSLILDFSNDLYRKDITQVFVIVDYVEPSGSYEESPYYCTPVDIGWHCINL